MRKGFGPYKAFRCSTSSLSLGVPASGVCVCDNCDLPWRLQRFPPAERHSNLPLTDLFVHLKKLIAESIETFGGRKRERERERESAPEAEKKEKENEVCVRFSRLGLCFWHTVHSLFPVQVLVRGEALAFSHGAKKYEAACVLPPTSYAGFGCFGCFCLVLLRKTQPKCEPCAFGFPLSQLPKKRQTSGFQPSDRERSPGSRMRTERNSERAMDHSS